MASKVKCPICGNKYFGDTCPDCGAPAPRKKKSGKLKWFIIAIPVILLFLIVIGSVGNSDSDDGKTEFTKTAKTSENNESVGENPNTEEVEKAESEEKEDNSETAAIDHTDKSEVNGEEKREEADSEHKTAEFEEIPLLESDEYTVKITAISDGFLKDYSWTFFIENKTDKGVTISLGDVSVDGVMSDPFWATEVAAHKKSYSDVDWYGLSKFGISAPTIIEGTLHIYDSDTWKDYYNEPFVVMPLGEDNVQTVSREKKETDEILIDNDYVTVTMTGFNTSDSLEMGLYIEAKTEKPVTVSIDDCSLNDIMCDPFWACSVMGNKVALSTVEWSKSSLEDSSLKAEDVTDISCSMRVYNSDSWEDYSEDSINLTKTKK